MLKCFICGNPVNEFDIHVINSDGDLACSKECKDRYPVGLK